MVLRYALVALALCAALGAGLALPGSLALAPLSSASPVADPLEPQFLPPPSLGWDEAPLELSAQPLLADPRGEEAEAAAPDHPSSSAPGAAVAAAVEELCELPFPAPLPRRGDPSVVEFWQQFREPLPPAPLWNPSGPKRVGLQAGHWLLEEAPPELERLQHGTSGGGKQEWEVNLDLAQRAKRLLEEAGVQVDLLPATVPVRYRAHAFLAIHADGDPAGRARGFKVVGPAFSSVPEADERLVEALEQAYAATTPLPRDHRVSRRMLYYYAFNSRRYCHAVAPGVPQAIIETGFLTSAQDRQLLLSNPEAAAQGIAQGLLAFLTGDPPPP